ncbi:mite group 2 allergen-like Ixo r 2 [Amblyomma americanum]
MIRYLVLAFLIGLASAQPRDLKFEDCGSKAKILAVRIEPCDSDPCIFKRGSKSTVQFSIVADQNSQEAKLGGKFKKIGIWLPIPGLESNLCKKVLPCPIVKGRKYDGIIKVSIPSWLPSIKTTFELKVSGDQGTSICLRINAIIQ